MFDASAPASPPALAAGPLAPHAHAVLERERAVIGEERVHLHREREPVVVLQVAHDALEEPALLLLQARGELARGVAILLRDRVLEALAAHGREVLEGRHVAL